MQFRLGLAAGAAVLSAAAFGFAQAAPSAVEGAESVGNFFGPAGTI
jgi:hypothetical protein